MLRFFALLRVSLPAGAGGGRAWVPQRAKHAHRFSKDALQQIRTRHHVQRANTAIRQQLNEEYGYQQRQHVQTRRSLDRIAADIVADRSHKHAQDKSQVHRTASARAEEMAAARQVLQLSEATRREMKRGRTYRTNAFRAEKKWR